MWFDTVLKSLSTFHDADQLDQFITVQVGDRPDDLGDCDWLTAEKSRLQTYLAMLIECAAARSWSQMLFVMCEPNSLASVLYHHVPTAKQMLEQSKKKWEAILKAEEFIKDRTANKATQTIVRKLLGFVGWNRLQCARECFLECEKGQWKVESQNIIGLARVMFGGPCQTKFDLEDLFAHLAKLSKAHQPTAMNKILS